MRVKEIMTGAIKTVAPSATAAAAWTMMSADHIHHLVVKDGGRIVGVFSSEDAGGRRGTRIREDQRVRDLMTERIVTVAPDAPVKRAANMMRGRNIGCLVVVDDGKPLGIVTTSDLLELLGRGALKPNPVSKRAPLNHRAPHKKHHNSFGVW